MNAWFTVESIDDTTFVISEYQHWEQPHAYLVLGEKKAALIDTGLGVGDLSKIVHSLTKLPILVITTHVHWDHIGSHGKFKEIAVHEIEKPFLEDWFPIPKEMVMMGLCGQPCEFPEGFDPDQYQVFHGPITQVLHDGDGINLGGRMLRVIHTPGHSPGHICLYEASKRYIYTGDLIYQGKLDAFYFSTSPQDFAASVSRIAALPVTKILPGHNSLNIKPSLIQEIDRAFQELAAKKQLVHGSGIHSFQDFQIHL